MVNLLEEDMVCRDFQIYLTKEYLCFFPASMLQDGCADHTLECGLQKKKRGPKEGKHLAQGFPADYGSLLVLVILSFSIDLVCNLLLQT